MQIRNDRRVDPAAHHVPNVGSFNLSANTHAAGAENAAIVIDGEALMRRINGQQRVAIGQTHMRETLILGHRLQFTMTVRDAH